MEWERKNVYIINGKIQVYENKLLGEGQNESNIFVGKYEGRDAAVKITEKEREEHLKHEKNHLLRCTHENILRFYGYEELDSKLYIALERCQGTLEDLVKGRKDFEKPVGSTKEIISQIVKRLQYLHENYIVHCDIRPISIFVSKPLRNSGEISRIKIARFGQSIRRSPRTGEQTEDEEDVSSESTNPITANKNNAVLSWVEPLCRILPSCDYDYGFWSDVFSFGLVCVYTASGGQHPFGETDEERITNLKGWIYNPEVFKSLDPCLLDLIGRTIVFHKRKRPNMKYILEHPFFWTDKQALEYLVTTFNDKINDTNNPHLKNSLDSINDSTRKLIVQQNWKDDYLKTNHPIIYNHAVHSSYDGTKIFHLLRFIRNKSEHYGEMDHDTKQHFGPKPETDLFHDHNYFRFWAENFPHLLIHVWRTIEKQPLIFSPDARNQIPDFCNDNSIYKPNSS